MNLILKSVPVNIVFDIIARELDQNLIVLYYNSGDEVLIDIGLIPIQKRRRLVLHILRYIDKHY